MCIRTVIDASAFRHLKEQTPKSAGHQLRNWIYRGDGIIMYSSKNTTYATELNRDHEVRALFRDYFQRGLARQVKEADVGAALAEIPDKPLRRSDDPHILALAKASHATVLFSCDNKLCLDFADKEIIEKTGKGQRRSVPEVFINNPTETANANKRNRFLNRRKCSQI